MSTIKSIIAADKVHESYFSDVPRGDEVMSILEFTECLYPNALREAMKGAGL